MPDWCSVFLRGDPDTPLREAADALALMVFKNGNREALDALVAGTDCNRHSELRRAAVQGLGLLGRTGSEVQTLLQKLIKDEDLEVQKWAIVALGNQRDWAFPIVHELIDMLKQDSEVTDYLQHAVQAITGKPSPISWPRKSSLLDLGWMAYDDPRYQGGWSFISGKNLNPRFVENSTAQKPAENQEQPEKPKE